MRGAGDPFEFKRQHENSNVHISRVPEYQNSTKGPPREEERLRMWRARNKKREILGGPAEGGPGEGGLGRGPKGGAPKGGPRVWGLGVWVLWDEKIWPKH